MTHFIVSSFDNIDYLGEDSTGRLYQNNPCHLNSTQDTAILCQLSNTIRTTIIPNTIVNFILESINLWSTD